MKRFAGVAVAVGVACLLAAPVAGATYPGHNGRVLYSPTWWAGLGYPSYEPNNPGYATYPSGVFSMRADGTHRRRLSALPGAVQPTSSPLGRKIAFAAATGPTSHTYELYTMDADGSNVRRITSNSAGDASPTWAPDGHALAEVRMRYRHGEPQSDAAELRVVSLTGKPERVLVRGPIRAASWGPASRLIAYSTGTDVFVVSAAGGKPLLVAHMPQGMLAGYLRWGPYSGTLLFSEVEDSSCPEVAVCARGVWAVYGIDYAVRGQLALRPPERITPFGVSALSGVWSPDGHHIVFCTPRDWVPPTWTLWTMRGDGSRAHDVREAPCPSDWQAKP